MSCERRARLLVRLYPRGWRERYGDEFEMLLIDEISERRRSLTRTADIVRSGLSARAAWAGLSGDALDADAQVRAGLKSLSLALIVFLAAAVAVWAQLTVGWQWSPPRAHLTATGMVLLTGAMALIALVTLAAGVPVAFVALREVICRRRARLLLPIMACATGVFVLVAGSSHFGHGWPGTGGHPWAQRALVPAFVARLCWAATLWITSYWAHPGALSSFPAAEVIWMVLSPLALILAVAGALTTVRRLPLSAGLLRFGSWLGIAAAAVMAAAVAGAASWICSGGPHPHGLFRVGAIDAVAVVLMVLTLIVAFRAAQRTLAAANRPASTA